MRSKFLFTILSATALVLGVMAFFKQNDRTVPAPAPPGPQKIVSAAPAAAYPPLDPMPAMTRTVTPQERETTIRTEKDNLLTWQMSDDPQCLSNILADLNSPEKEIRMAAIQAAVEFASTNAIPALRTQAANDDDADEKTALLQAADYLALPPLVLTTNNAPMTTQQARESAQRRSDSQNAFQARLSAQSAPPAAQN